MYATLYSQLKERKEPIFPRELLVKIVREKKVAAFLNLAISYIENTSDFNHNLTTGEIAIIQRTEIERVMEEFAVAIGSTFYHCGHPVTCSGSYSFEQRKYSFEVACQCCNQAIKI